MHIRTVDASSECVITRQWKNPNETSCDACHHTHHAACCKWAIKFPRKYSGAVRIALLMLMCATSTLEFYKLVWHLSIRTAIGLQVVWIVEAFLSFLEPSRNCYISTHRAQPPIAEHISNAVFANLMRLISVLFQLLITMTDFPSFSFANKFSFSIASPFSTRRQLHNDKKYDCI